MNKDKISTGKFEVDNVVTRKGEFWRVKEPLGVSICNVTTRNWEYAQANAELISEAFNVFSKTGMTPEELFKAFADFENSGVGQHIGILKKRIKEIELQRDTLVNYLTEFIDNEHQELYNSEELIRSSSSYLTLLIEPNLSKQENNG